MTNQYIIIFLIMILSSKIFLLHQTSIFLLTAYLLFLCHFCLRASTGCFENVKWDFSKTLSSALWLSIMPIKYLWKLGCGFRFGGVYGSAVSIRCLCLRDIAKSKGFPCCLNKRNRNSLYFAWRLWHQSLGCKVWYDYIPAIYTLSY